MPRKDSHLRFMALLFKLFLLIVVSMTVAVSAYPNILQVQVSFIGEDPGMCDDQGGNLPIEAGVTFDAECYSDVYLLAIDQVYSNSSLGISIQTPFQIEEMVLDPNSNKKLTLRAQNGGFVNFGMDYVFRNPDVRF